MRTSGRGIVARDLAATVTWPVRIALRYLRTASLRGSA